MKTALDYYARGKQREVNANEYNRDWDYGRERFICPECGEAVHLTGNKDSNYFAHYKKSDLFVECDRRVDGTLTTSIYVRMGLPIYLRKDNEDKFSLHLGFKALSERILSKAISESILVKMDGKHTYKVNEERFSCASTSLIPLDYIPASGQSYRISFEPENKADIVLQHWSDHTDRFLYEGMIFTVSERGGKKIHCGDSISTDVEYYWVRRQKIIPSLVPGIQMELCGEIILKNEKLNVFRGIFSSTLSNAQFGVLTSFLRNSLKIHLLEKQPEFIPIWPPVIRTEEGYIRKEKSIYGYIRSGNEEPKVYIYEGINKIPKEILLDRKLLRIDMQEETTLVNIDRKYVSSGTMFWKRNRKITGKGMGVYKLCNTEYISIGACETDIVSQEYVLKADNYTEYFLIRKNGEIERKIGVGAVLFEKLQTDDSIVCLQAGCIKYIFFVSSNAEIVDTEILDKRIYQDFQLYASKKEVILPVELRKKLMKNQERFSIARKYIDYALKYNCIPSVMIKILEEMLDE